MADTIAPSASLRAGPAAVRVMLHRCGLSQTDAAAFLDVQVRTVQRWVNGERSPSDEQWQQLVELCERQDRAADAMLAGMRRLVAAKVGHDPEAEEVTVRLARTQDDAERLGWPCPGAHLAVVSRVVGRAPKGVRVVPVWSDDDEAVDVGAMLRAAH